MPRWWKIDDISLMKQIFSYHVGEEGCAKILARFAEPDARAIRRIEWDGEA
jgi:hypothetical protein